ncbi:uncharacterized protein N7482_001923 [Penicillium canariense]|uniref:Uncharacterized protein n=1 Tax=Penicillium canariense TaxID=189055 RepID=A0A9W9LTJ8_9EURO|nr:uncharacterized protein N7482_001923 [Penicillium canariense]KAJ5176046.1 hypothetical protein N7482_001923 [Penicillium canariense]
MASADPNITDGMLRRTRLRQIELGREAIVTTRTIPDGDHVDCSSRSFLSLPGPLGITPDGHGMSDYSGCGLGWTDEWRTEYSVDSSQPATASAQNTTGNQKN